MKKLEFPKDFVWGASAASFQIEGAWNEDGKSESIWDRFCRTPGNILNGDTGDVACDFYHRYREDIDIMARLGLQVQRLSISWPRVLPEGTGRVNEKGLDFYRRVVDAMLEKGIRPFLMIYHWDLPQCLQEKGGWLNRDTASYMAELAEIVFRAFPREVPLWGTVLEPHVAAYNGYFYGSHAPGYRDLSGALLAAHNLLRAHGLTVQAFRASGAAGEIGITNLLSPVYPVSDREEDRAAAARYDGFANRWFTDPVELGTYPEDMLRLYGDMDVVLPKIVPGDMELISTPSDFFGLNFYQSSFVTSDPAVWPIGCVQRRPEGREFTAMDWAVCPDGFHDILMQTWRRYGKKILVTENGAAFADKVSEDGQVHDPRRLDFYREHLKALHAALEEGADIRGYLAWSSFDNFEWALGYDRRFGMTYVDYPTQKRIIKDSGKWYADTIRGNGFYVDD